MIVIVDGKRYDTDNLEQLIGRQPKQRHAQGVTLLGVYRTKNGRILVVTDSIWDRGDGVTVGVRAHFANPEGIVALAEEYGSPFIEMVPIGE